MSSHLRRFRLQTKLIASYFALGLCVTLLSVFGQRYVARQTANRALVRSELMRRVLDVGLLTGAVAEESFSFVLSGDRDEKARSLSKIDAADAYARDLMSDARLTPSERESLAQVTRVVAVQRSAMLSMFESYDRSGSVADDRYRAYETAIDDVADRLGDLRRVTEAEGVGDAALWMHRSDWLMLGVGAVALLVSVAIGTLLGRSMAKPIASLRRAVRALGKSSAAQGPADSGDEIDELAAAFDGMAKEVRRHMDRLEDVFGSIDEGLVVCDANGVISAVNASCCRISNRAEHKLVGTNAATLFGSSLAELTRSGAVSRQRDVVIRTTDGREIEVRLTASRLLGRESDGWVLVARDLTEHHRLEAELRQAQKMEAIGSLAGGVAHDFNNMLSIILGFTVILLEGREPSDPAYDGLIEIKRAAERSADLTRQLLAFARQEPFELQIVNPNEVAETTCGMVGRILGKNIVVHLMLGNGVGRVEVGTGQLEQVIMNLVVNARDAMPEGGTLSLETRSVTFAQDDLRQHESMRPGTYAVLAVTDDGIGMGRQTQERIFEPFFTTKEQGKGTGLGLSTVFGIVRQAGGHIYVASQLGKGSTFTIYLPERAAVPLEGAVLGPHEGAGSPERFLSVAG
jgi:PAS domain S-box-containing protein